MEGCWGGAYTLGSRKVLSRFKIADFLGKNFCVDFSNKIGELEKENNKLKKQIRGMRSDKIVEEKETIENMAVNREVALCSKNG